MSIPAIILLVIISLEFGFVIANHGMPRREYNTFSYLLGVAITLSILYWGGFFD